jgi:hypothetical protein
LIANGGYVTKSDRVYEAKSCYKPGSHRLEKLKVRLERKGEVQEVKFSPSYEADEVRDQYHILGKHHGSFLVRVYLSGVTQVLVIKTMLGERAFRCSFKREWQIVTQ